MNVQPLQIDRDKARELWRKYQTHRAYQEPHDAEIAAIYKRLAQGRTVIRALESIRAAGVTQAEGLPKLAIARADTSQVWLHKNGRDVWFADSRNANLWRASRSKRSKAAVAVLWPEFPELKRYTYAARVPLIPVHLRPKRGLANYHILFEAEWSQRYPVDPYLLRRFGADAWLVVAAWELTDVERAVMDFRLNA